MSQLCESLGGAWDDGLPVVGNRVLDSLRAAHLSGHPMPIEHGEDHPAATAVPASGSREPPGIGQ
jgi:hypothetical protein